MSGSFVKRNEIRLLTICMALLASAAGWVVSTRPAHRIEGDFLAREQRREVDAWLLRQARDNPIAEQRARAFLALGRIGAEGTRELLLAALEDPAPSVKAFAAFGLGLIADGETADAEIAAGLIALLDDDDRRAVTYAVEALGKMRWSAAAARVARTPAPLAVTLTALVRMNAVDLAPEIAGTLRSDDQDTRWAAVTALEELEAPVDERLQRSYVAMAGDPNNYVRAAVARGLGRLDPTDEVFAALAKMTQDQDPKVRVEAVRSLGRIGDRARLELLEAALQDQNPNVQQEAARAVKSLVESVEPLPPRDPQPSAEPIGDIPEPFDDKELQTIARTIGRELLIETRIGEFELALDFDNAPAAAQRFYQLVLAGAYSGTSIAVVRPNGYVQVAVGDEHRSPLRRQPSPQPFLRGSIGLVRSAEGLDTAEFFIALTPLPFADSRYTNVGRLISGDALLDQLTVGMRILEIREQ